MKTKQLSVKDEITDCFAATHFQSRARDNFFASGQRQPDNIKRLSRQGTTQQILASGSCDNVFRDNTTETTIF